MQLINVYNLFSSQLKLAVYLVQSLSPFSMINANYSHVKILNRYMPSIQSRKKYKRQCLKYKNILEENESVQIGCRIEKLYDFYTSKNFVQISIFIGNKLSKPIQKYSIDFKGTDNLQVFLEQKEEKNIKENTQAKQRIIIQLLPTTNREGTPTFHQILLVMSFTSPMLTLNDTVIPLSLWSFYCFPANLQKIIPPTTSLKNLQNQFKEKFELIEEQTMDLNTGLFKKGFNGRDLQKYLQSLIKLTNSKNQATELNQLIFAGVFTMKNLLQEIGIIVQVVEIHQEPKLRVMLAGNEYIYFESIFQNVKFLFSS